MFFVPQVKKAFQGRVALPGYSANRYNASLALSGLRSSDSGLYRCEIVVGINDEQDTVPLEVTGESFNRYADQLPLCDRAALMGRWNRCTGLSLSISTRENTSICKSIRCLHSICVSICKIQILKMHKQIYWQKHFEQAYLCGETLLEKRSEWMFYYCVDDSLLVPTSGFVEMSFMHYKITEALFYYKELGICARKCRIWTILIWNDK